MSLVYLYDGSFDGLLTAVFHAYDAKRHPDAMAEEENLQVEFGQEVVRVPTDEAKARRVEKGILSKLGAPVQKKIWTAYLAGTPDKATAIYRYIRRGLSIGRLIYSDLAHPDVLAMDKLNSLVGRESHLLIEFLRFSQMEGGAFYAKISPEHYVVPLMMPHFVDRYCVQPFLIHDDVHGVAGIYDRKEWYLVETADMEIPDITTEELDFRRMWKEFYGAIAIRERFNPRCRRSHMPKKYWKNMTEMNFVETPMTARIDARRGAAMSRGGGGEAPSQGQVRFPGELRGQG